MKLYDKLMQMASKDYTADDRRIEKAIRASEDGNLHHALSLYTELIERYEVSELYNQRGIVNLELGDYESALSDLTTAIELQSSDPDCFINRANVYLRMNKFTQALGDYEIACSMSPKNALALNGRGYTKFKLGDKLGAFDDLWAAVSADNGYLSPLYNLALVCKAMGQYEEARTYLARALDIRPCDDECLKLLAKIDKLVAKERSSQ